VFSLLHRRLSWERLISDLLSPPVVWGFLAFPVALRAAGTPQRALQWALVYVALVCVLPAAYIAFEVWQGRITDVHINLREQRLRPYLVSLIGTGLAWLVLQLMGAPELMPMFTLFTLIQMAMMLLLTTRWKVSMHAMSITSAVITAGVLYGLPVFLLLTPLILLVGTARVRLRRHSVSQVVSGILLGGGITVVMAIALTPLL
jgi:membrane-associated phospholipid phosphatase